MQMPMTAEDVLVSIFYCLQQKKRIKEVTADRERLHRAFFSAKEKYPKIMQLFTFREREFFRESTQLDQALSNLDATGLISRQNLTPRWYRFENPLENSYNKFSKNILVNAGIAEEEIQPVADFIQCLVAENQE